MIAALYLSDVCEDVNFVKRQFSLQRIRNSWDIRFVNVV